MSDCIQHPENPTKFQCKGCKKELCSLCKPVSFHGDIFCHTCLDKEESKYFKKEDKKDAFWTSLQFKIGLGAITGLLILIFTIYYIMFAPKVVELNVNDRERVQFFLDMAYEAGKGTATYDRNVHNIKRMNAKYINILRYLSLAENALEKNQADVAIENYKKVKVMLPDWHWVYIFLGEVYLKKGTTEEGEIEIKQAIELNPEGTKAYILLSKYYEQQERLDEAILQLSKASFNDKKNGDILIELGKLYLKKKWFVKARELRNKARNLNADTSSLDKMIEDGVLQ